MRRKILTAGWLYCPTRSRAEVNQFRQFSGRKEGERSLPDGVDLTQSVHLIRKINLRRD